MWALHNQQLWDDLEPLEDPLCLGRRLDTGGFVLADPMEVILRELSVGYLQSLWEQLEPLLDKYWLAIDDLSWGVWIPGDAGVWRAAPEVQTAPGAFVGLISRELEGLYAAPLFEALDVDLSQMRPALYGGGCWKSCKWRIPPDSYELALRLIEAWYTEDVVPWDPRSVLVEGEVPQEPWRAIAYAIQEQGQARLDSALAAAQATYSPLGYRIVLRAYTALVSYDETSLILPPLPTVDF